MNQYDSEPLGEQDRAQIRVWFLRIVLILAFGVCFAFAKYF